MHIYTLTVHCCLYWYIFYTWHSSFVRCYCWAILNLIIIIPTDYYMEPCPFVVSNTDVSRVPVYNVSCRVCGLHEKLLPEINLLAEAVKIQVKKFTKWWNPLLHCWEWMHHVCDCKLRRFASVCVIRLNPNAHALQRIICRLRLAYINKKHFRLVCIPTIRTYRYY